MIFISRPIKWERLGWGNAIKKCPQTDWLYRFTLRHRRLRQWLRWRML